MSIPEILEVLNKYTGRLPLTAMREAIQQREVITPELLRVLETVAENPEEAARREGMLHVFALYLLAQFREKRAYPFIVKMFSAPGEIPFELAGDTVAEGLNRIFASVYDGNPAPLQGLVENEDVNKYVRDAAIDAFVALAHTGQMSREEVVACFTSLFHGKLKRHYSQAWNGLVVAVSDLPAPELLDDVRQAYAENLVGTWFVRLEDIERDLRERKPGLREKYPLIGDAIAEMEWWAAFKTAEKPSPKKKKDVPTPGVTPPEPKVHKKPWRNARCPCGSGKKYKHCCGKV